MIGQSKGYQHESISNAIVTLYELGKRAGRWETYFRTDCLAIIKKPLKWEAKNLNDFDAIVFYSMALVPSRSWITGERVAARVRAFDAR